MKLLIRLEYNTDYKSFSWTVTTVDNDVETIIDGGEESSLEKAIECSKHRFFEIC